MVALTRSPERDGRGPLRLAALVLTGIICAVVFSKGYSPQTPETPNGFRSEPANAEESAVWPGSRKLSQDHESAAGAVVPIDDGGGASPESESEPQSATLCECGDLHKLWLCEPRMVGKQVRDLQEGLAVAGFPAGHVDGLFGPATEGAVRAFQASVGLSEDGIVDLSVWMTLGRVCEQIVAASLEPSGDIIPIAKTTDEQIGAGPEAKSKAKASPAKPQTEQEGTTRKGLPPGWRALLIDTSNLTITLLEDGLPIKQYRVGVGEPSTPTPLGQFKVIEKAAWAGGFGTRWMGLNVPWGKYGIHGTNKPWTVGQRKSGGCIRMLNRDVEELYSMVPVGTPVVITAGHFGTLGSFRPRIEPGAKGSYVLEVQKRLAKLGYEHAGFDGVYGPGTERAIMQLQRDKGLPVTGIVDMRTYEALGLFIFD